MTYFDQRQEAVPEDLVLLDQWPSELQEWEERAVMELPWYKFDPELHPEEGLGSLLLVSAVLLEAALEGIQQFKSLCELGVVPKGFILLDQQCHRAAPAGFYHV